MALAYIRDSLFTGATGRALRGHPADVRELQLWLIAGPTSDRFGLYHFELEVTALQLGRTAGGVRKSLAVLSDLGFCQWDEPTQWLWVVEMAHHQFQTPLKAADLRCAMAQKWYAALPINPWLGEWFDRYRDDFHLESGTNGVSRRDSQDRVENGASKPLRRGSEGASKPHVLSTAEDLVFDLTGSTTQDPRTRGREESVPNPDTPLKGTALEDAFEAVWRVYPNAVERKDARGEFGRLRPSAALVTTMLAAVEEQKSGRSWREGYIPKLANWLSKHRWEDRVENGPTMTKKTAGTVAAAERFAHRPPT